MIARLGLELLSLERMLMQRFASASMVAKALMRGLAGCSRENPDSAKAAPQAVSYGDYKSVAELHDAFREKHLEDLDAYLSTSGWKQTQYYPGSRFCGADFVNGRVTLRPHVRRRPDAPLRPRPPTPRAPAGTCSVDSGPTGASDFTAQGTPQALHAGVVVFPRLLLASGAPMRGHLS